MGRRRKGRAVSGWINLYKPAGITSTQAPERLLGAGAFMTAEDFADPRLRDLIETQV